MEINGVPLHPLVVHAAVVFVPLSALAAIVLAVPKWRWLARWPTLVIALIAAVVVQISVMSGVDLRKSRGLDTELVATHELWAGRLRIAVFVLTAVVALAFWVMPHVTRLLGGRDRAARVAVLEKPLMVVMPAAAVVVLVLVFLTGEAGARAVWSTGG